MELFEISKFAIFFMFLDTYQQVHPDIKVCKLKIKNIKKN